MKLENAEVSSQGSLALQLSEAKSKSKSGGSTRGACRQAGHVAAAGCPCCLAVRKTRGMASPTAAPSLGAAEGWDGLCGSPGF